MSQQRYAGSMHSLLRCAVNRTGQPQCRPFLSNASSSVGRFFSSSSLSSSSSAHTHSFRSSSCHSLSLFSSIQRQPQRNISLLSHPLSVAIQSSPVRRTLLPFCSRLSRSFATTATDPRVGVGNVRNVAIIAHVDHGKTTLVDGLLRQSITRISSSDTRVMDANPLEKERGITILSKCTSIVYQRHADNNTNSEASNSNNNNNNNNEFYQINIIDTPGHADFGGEVERVLSMVDGVVLVVDATDGPMTQTRFVLSKALQRGLAAVVVVNKVDRASARVGEVENEIFDLFVNLNATDKQMDFPIIYASAREGWATVDAKNRTTNLHALFRAIIDHVAAPRVERDAPFSMLVTQLESDKFLGKLLIGRVQTGTIKTGDSIIALDDHSKQIEEVRVMKLLSRRGLEQIVVDEAWAGDIVSVAGLSTASVNSTLAAPTVKQAIPSTPIDPPTLAMTFGVNDSPFAGREGTLLTSNLIRMRLEKEAETNVSIALRVNAQRESCEVRGRGELQLGVLIETMRREGYELSISAPRVVFQNDEKGEVLEPMEEVHIDVDDSDAGAIIEQLSSRKGTLKDYTQTPDGKAKLSFVMPMRGLIGFRSELTNMTRGSGVMNTLFAGYSPHLGPIDRSAKGAIVSLEDGKATNFSLEQLQERGPLFIQPGEEVYNGMVIGESSRDDNVECNPCKLKQLSNVRSTTKEERVKLQQARVMTLEQIIAYVRDDEVIEVTPKSVRLRKLILDSEQRKRNNKSSAQAKRDRADR